MLCVCQLLNNQDLIYYFLSSFWKKIRNVSTYHLSNKFLQINLTGIGPDGIGSVSGGSRVIQWGWYPVGGASNFDAGLTPNYLVATTFVGTVTVS